MNPNLVPFKKNQKLYFDPKNDSHELLYDQKYQC